MKTLKKSLEKTARNIIDTELKYCEAYALTHDFEKLSEKLLQLIEHMNEYYNIFGLYDTYIDNEKTMNTVSLMCSINSLYTGFNLAHHIEFIIHDDDFFKDEIKIEELKEEDCEIVDDDDNFYNSIDKYYNDKFDKD